MLIASLAPPVRAQLAGLASARNPADVIASGDSGSLSAAVALTPLAAVDPVPEPRTAAVALCGLFVTILIGRSLYIRYRRSNPIAQSRFL
jgi:hypothetical protein